MSTTPIAPETTEAAVVARHAIASARLEEIEPDRLYASTVPRHVLDLEHLQETPRRKREEVDLNTGESFGVYVNRHKDTGQASLYADPETARVVAVLNDSGENFAGWLDHRATLILRKTPAWKFWERQDGKEMSQQAFAQHLEDGVREIVEPDPATMLEIALTLEGTAGARFEESVNLQHGARHFVWVETVQARAGQQHETDIPRQFTLQLQPFEGSMTVKIAAKFRFRPDSGGLKLAYQLDRPDLVLRMAFDGELRAIEAATELKAFLGTPPVRP